MASIKTMDPVLGFSNNGESYGYQYYAYNKQSFLIGETKHGLWNNNNKYSLYNQDKFVKEFHGNEITQIKRGDDFWLRYLDQKAIDKIMIYPQVVGEGTSPIEAKILRAEMKRRSQIILKIGRQRGHEGLFDHEFISLEGNKLLQEIFTKEGLEVYEKYFNFKLPEKEEEEEDSKEEEYRNRYNNNRREEKSKHFYFISFKNCI